MRPRECRPDDRLELRDARWLAEVNLDTDVRQRSAVSRPSGRPQPPNGCARERREQEDEGLKGGETVVIEGNYSLPDGTRVEIAKDQADENTGEKKEEEK